MKKYLILLIVIPFIFSSCNTHQKELQQGQIKSDSLQKQIAQRDQTVNGFLSDFNDIQQNLNTIKEKEKMITMNTANKKGELKKDTKEQINSDIKDIYDLLIKNKKIIASLSKKLKKSDLKIAELQKMIDNMTKQIMDKDAEIETMKGQLAKLNIEVAHLSSHVDSLGTVTKTQEKVIEQKTSEINTAYYIIGTKQELKDKKIISKEGGFIGLGRVSQMLTTVDKKNSTQVDITKVTSIAINKKKAKLITTHPDGTYKLNEASDMVKDITITNQKEFWSVSKFLVIEVK
jgi:hypothetical protein